MNGSSQLMHIQLLALCVASLGCGAATSLGSGDVGGTDTASRDVSELVPDVPSIGSDITPDSTPDIPSVPAGPGCMPIAGKEPFGVVLGTPAGVPYGGMTLLFPKGRVAGATALLVQPLSYVSGLAVGTGILGADLGNPKMYVSDMNCPGGVDGALVGPNDGVIGRAFYTTSGPGTDAVTMAEAPISLCGVGPIPELAYSMVDYVLPTDPIALVSNTPIDPTTLTGMTASGIPVVGSIGRDQRAILLPAKGGVWAPGAYSFDVGAVRDVMGRKMKGAFSVEVPGPKGAATDLEFDTVPSFDAFAMFGATTKAGILTVGASSSLAILGLGDKPGSSKATIRHHSLCDKWTSKQVSIVSADGGIVRVPISCTFEETTVVLPGKGPYYLILDDRMYSRPCHYSATFPANYEIDYVRFVK